MDLHAVYSWVSAWLWQGVSPYSPPTDLVQATPWWTMQNNYAPYAIAFVSPLALIPARWVTLFWVVVNIPLAVAVLLLSFRLFKPTAPLKHALVPGLIFLCWVGVRVGLSTGQLSLLMVFFGLLAVTIADRRPAVGGILLGLSLIKPHVGIAFFGWMVVTRRFKPVLLSIGVLLLGACIYSVRLAQNPVIASQEYTKALRSQFGGESFAVGVFELRPVVHFLIPNFAVADILSLAISLVLAGVILLVAVSMRHADRRERDLLLLQLCSLWGLMAVFHNPYDSILMLPVVFGLYKTIEIGRSEKVRQTANRVLWIVQAALIIDVAGRWRTVSNWLQLSDYELLGALSSHFDRALILTLFVFIAVAGLSARFASGRPLERNATA